MAATLDVAPADHRVAGKRVRGVGRGAEQVGVVGVVAVVLLVRVVAEEGEDGLGVVRRVARVVGGGLAVVEERGGVPEVALVVHRPRVVEQDDDVPGAVGGDPRGRHGERADADHLGERRRQGDVDGRLGQVVQLARVEGHLLGELLGRRVIPVRPVGDRHVGRRERLAEDRHGDRGRDGARGGAGGVLRQDPVQGPLPPVIAATSAAVCTSTRAIATRPRRPPAPRTRTGSSRQTATKGGTPRRPRARASRPFHNDLPFGL